MNDPIEAAPAPAIRIEQGYRPGLAGRVVTLHADTYSRWAGFGAAFEGKVASGLAGFIQHLDRPDNGIWHASAGDRLIGSIVIDGEDLDPGSAHLRWFIVDPSSRGTGLGGRLLNQALAFVDERRFERTKLWTLKGLDAARSLYERHGFVLVDEYQGDQWGRAITEQTFVRQSQALK